MYIIEYEERYLNRVRDLLTELEEYLVSIDKDNLDMVHPDYWDKMALIDLDDVNRYSGRCYLALDNDHVVGLIMGIIPEYGEYDHLDYKCPRKGVITELIVSDFAQGEGIGKALIEKMEEYFKGHGCEYSFVDVFAYNDRAVLFYNRNGYHHRMFADIKQL